MRCYKNNPVIQSIEIVDGLTVMRDVDLAFRFVVIPDIFSYTQA